MEDSKKIIEKEFILMLLSLTVNYSKNKPSENLNIVDKLSPYLSTEFIYNKTKGIEGLKLLCRHMKELRTAFPDLNLSVNYFKDIFNLFSKVLKIKEKKTAANRSLAQ